MGIPTRVNGIPGKIRTQYKGNQLHNTEQGTVNGNVRGGQAQGTDLKDTQKIPGESKKEEEETTKHLYK